MQAGLYCLMYLVGRDILNICNVFRVWSKEEFAPRNSSYDQRARVVIVVVHSTKLRSLLTGLQKED